MPKAGALPLKLQEHIRPFDRFQKSLSVWADAKRIFNAGWLMGVWELSLQPPEA